MIGSPARLTSLKMGYLVEGIGDEVLLFGAFLTFATCVVIFVNSWRERENRQRQGQSNQTPGMINKFIKYNLPQAIKLLDSSKIYTILPTLKLLQVITLDPL